MAGPTPATLASRCTIITTTSPTPSNPATELLEETLRSLGEHAPELLACRNIIVCDGYRSGETSRFRCGLVTAERAGAYEAYVGALERLAARAGSAPWRHAEVMRLPDRHGFGFAVRAALQHVNTPYVLILQHDRTFMRPFAMVSRLLLAMDADPRLKMVGLPTTTNDPSRYVAQAESKLRQLRVQFPPLDAAALSSAECPGLRFIPMIMWHDSTHFASTAYYRDFVFGKRGLVSRGGFIEDKLGQQQGSDLRTIGWSTHAEYGTWLLDDGVPPPTRMVGHLDGKVFLRRAEKEALQALGRAGGAAGAGGAPAGALAAAPSAAQPAAAQPASADAEELRAPIRYFLMTRPGSQ